MPGGAGAGSARLGFGDYLREAFLRKAPVPGLGALPLNLMALGVFAVLGIANPGFWLLGVAAEVAYLTGVAGSRRFQKLVQGERLLGVQRDWESKVAAAVERLPREAQDRYHRLLAECRRILGISERLDLESLGDFRDLRSRGLNQLLGIFLRLLTSRQLIAENLREVGERKIEDDIARLERALAEAGEPTAPLARSLQGTLDIQRKRLENLSRGRTSLTVIDAELARIERQVELIREESAVARSPEAVSRHLDAVTSTMAETNRFLESNAQLFADLGADEAAAPVPELPQLPQAVEEG